MNNIEKHTKINKNAKNLKKTKENKPQEISEQRKIESSKEIAKSASLRQNLKNRKKIPENLLIKTEEIPFKPEEKLITNTSIEPLIEKKPQKYSKPQINDHNLPEIKEILPETQEILTENQKKILLEQKIKTKEKLKISTTSLKLPEILPKPQEKSLILTKSKEEFLKSNEKPKEPLQNKFEPLPKPEKLVIDVIIERNLQKSVSEKSPLISDEKYSSRKSQKQPINLPSFSKISIFKSKEEISLSPNSKEFDLDKELTESVEKIKNLNEEKSPNVKMKKSTFSSKDPNKTPSTKRIISKIPSKINNFSVEIQKLSENLKEIPLQTPREPLSMKDSWKTPIKQFEDTAKYQELLAQQKRNEIQAFLNSIGDKVEEHMLSQNNCVDKLKNFFDETQLTLKKTNENSYKTRQMKFSNQIKNPAFMMPNEVEMRKIMKNLKNKNDELTDSETEITVSRCAGDFFAEKLRRKAFKKQRNVFELLKKFVEKNNSIVKQVNIEEMDRNIKESSIIERNQSKFLKKNEVSKENFEEKTIYFTEEKEMAEEKLKIFDKRKSLDYLKKKREVKEIEQEKKEYGVALRRKKTNGEKKSLDEFFLRSKKRFKIKIM